MVPFDHTLYILVYGSNINMSSRLHGYAVAVYYCNANHNII